MIPLSPQLEEDSTLLFSGKISNVRPRGEIFSFSFSVGAVPLAVGRFNVRYQV